MKKFAVLLMFLLAVTCVFAGCDGLDTLNTSTFTVTFDAQDGTSPQKVKLDENFTVPVPTREGYEFGGWYTDADCTDGNEWTLPETLTENITVYAKWTATSAETSDFSAYADSSTWNFVVKYVMTDPDGSTIYDDVLNFVGEDFSWVYAYEETTYTDYVVYDTESEQYVYYYDNGDGTYDTYGSSDDEDTFDYYYASAPMIDLSSLDSLSFTKGEDCYIADDAVTAGNSILGDWGMLWYEVKIYVGDDGKISKITASMVDNQSESTADVYKVTATFSDYGSVTLTLPSGGGSVENDEEFTNVVAQYADYSEWNFAVSYVSEELGYDDVLKFVGEDFAWVYVYDETTYTDYVVYDTESGQYVYYYDNGDGTYDTYGSSDDEDSFYYYYMYAPYLDLSALSEYAFEKQSDGIYAASNPNAAGNAVLGEWEDSSWTSFQVAFSDGKISTITAVMKDTAYDETYNYTLTFSDFGKVTLDLPNGGDDKNNTTAEVMPEQTYDAETFDSKNLQEQIIAYETEEYGEGAIGLPSTGTYNALVVPVQFGDAVISDDSLSKLNKAFNGTSADTGWESVGSYYRTSSYGKLNLTFDIWGYNIGETYGNFTAAKSAVYYSTSKTNENDYYGAEEILREVLAYVVDKIDLTKYDANNDGCIDAVYIIYDYDVDYDSADFWWAYVTTSDDEATYDNLYPYYYLFAGFDFMDEGVTSSVEINAETYIHETGHLLCLDDYYDYYTDEGSNQGLGGADMMDYNIGDHGVYNKIMLGWIEPEIITSSQTFTIDLSDDSSDTTNNCVMLLLDSNNSYFCEYLLIDLYSATGLNEWKSDELYGGADYGVRIYHVSSSISNPYSDDYYSFTDNNNSLSKNALIKLVEADIKGSTKGDYTSQAKDLWQEGGTLGYCTNYCRNDGKIVNFNITVGEVTSTSATITIDFVE